MGPQHRKLMSKTKVAIRRAIHYRWEKREERIKPHLYRMDGVRETPASTTIRRVDVMALANGLIPIPIKSHAIRTHTHNKRAGNSSLLFYFFFFFLAAASRRPWWSHQNGSVKRRERPSVLMMPVVMSLELTTIVTRRRRWRQEIDNNTGNNRQEIQ